VSDEDDYFRKLDQEAKAKLKAKLDAQNVEAEKAAARALHFMKCGKCGGEMQTTVFRGIEIEVCSGCGAVLLDPGELEELAGADTTAVFSSFFTMFGAGRKER
jgi:ribosomal protein S27E